ncbi:XRE family transcriptional regulator [Photobacterium aquimaris]|uniref:cytoskeleton protein RodZ n=1 Tax=Photobacterium aquimaris TaxID=512643 RepID=UPI0007F003E1|nr:cytoskeleton protein RodZ [Photobacterium aquimaris]OBU16543.1 XRE family transcriptional regulator [Photobacterium aquimaris]PSW02747.1 cytoskeleton protein RodZ [Photobacterium aquimaris]
MNTEHNDSPQPNNVVRPGDMLRQAREQLGYSQADIANRLRLRLSVINDIESNCFDSEKISTFTRGYVRSYAKYVGLDDVAVVGLLDDYGHSKPKAQEMQSFSRRTNREAHDSRIMGLTWILAVIFVGVTAVWWWQNSHLDRDLTPAVDVANIESSALTDNTSAVVEPSAATVTAETATTNTAVTDVTPTPTDVTTSNVTSAAINTDTVQTPAVATEAATVIKPVAAITTDTSTAAVTPTATADVAGADVTVAPALALTFAADCWIDIRDANGKRLESGLKTAGQTLAVDGKAPFRVRLGAPSAVKIEIKGQPFDLSRYPAGRPVTLTLP